MDVTKPFKLGPNQTKWLAALKSGEYQHAKCRLGRIVDGVEKNCCLGVGARIFGCKRGVVVEPEKWGTVPACTVAIYDGCNQYAPSSLVQSLRLRDDNGRLESLVDDLDSLAALNDWSTDYAPIIRIIEETPELIFTEPA